MHVFTKKNNEHPNVRFLTKIKKTWVLLLLHNKTFTEKGKFVSSVYWKEIFSGV